MTPETRITTSQVYFVKVGHAELDVKSHDPADAIRQARRQLSTEFPRMWDVIHAMNDDEFSVVLKD